MNHRKQSICSSSRNWAELPPELRDKIGEHLNSRIDIFRFRAVCSSWRSAVSLSLPPPLITLPSPYTTTTSSSSHIKNSSANFISSVTICRLEGPHPNSACLVKLLETPSGYFDVLNPLTIPKPDFIFGKTLNSLNFRLFPLVQGSHFSSASSHVQKVVAFRDSGFLAIYHNGKLGFTVSTNSIWHNLGDVGTRYADILVYQGDYYVIDNLGVIFLIDKLMNLVKYMPPLNSSGHLKNLVESNGDVYVVDTYFRQQMVVDDDGDENLKRDERVDMKVYKLDEELGTWVQVNSLKDRIFILGKDVCFSVSANDFPGCQGNCIYFIDSVSLGEDLPGYQSNDEEMDISLGSLIRPCCRSMRNVVRSLSIARYYDLRLGYYSPRVYNLDDCSTRELEGSPSFKRLFLPPKDCFCSTLSFP